MIGPAMDTALSRYLAGPVVPTVLGHDARLQLLHEQDALGALERATMAGRAGTFNVGAAGIIMMSQAIRRSGRVPLPVPRSALSAVDSLTARHALHGARSRAVELPELRPGHGHRADAKGPRLQPEVDDGGGFRRLRARPWFDADRRPGMGTLGGESRGICGAALGALDSQFDRVGRG